MSLLDIFNKSDKKVNRQNTNALTDKSKHVSTGGRTPTQTPTYSVLDLDGKEPSNKYTNRLPK